MLEGHDAYVDVGGWSPVEDVLVTAASDRSCYLWRLEADQPAEKVEVVGEDLSSADLLSSWM